MEAEKTYLSADEFLRDTWRLAAAVRRSGWRPDVMVALWRGGAPVGVAVHEYLKCAGWSVRHIPLKCASYTGIGENEGEVVFTLGEEVFGMLRPGERVLVVDDVFDTGKTGVMRTIELMRQNGMTVAGARLDVSEPRSPIVEVKGVKIGIVAYTYETTTGERRLINGNPIWDGGTDYINSFRCESGLAYAVEADRAAIAAEIQSCRDRGADLVICYFHWGNEYQREYNAGEEKMARYAADAGADIIFASHPHLLQGVDCFEYQVKYPEPEPEVEEVQPEPEEEKEPWIIRVRKHFGLIKEEEPEIEEPVVEEPKPEYWTKKVPVYYSMGNLVSNQRVETMSDYIPAKARFTEQGMIAWVDLDYDPVTGEISNLQMKCLPTWVEKYKKNGHVEYYIIPLDKDLASNPELANSGHLARAQQALQDVKDLISPGESPVCQVIDGY